MGYIAYIMKISCRQLIRSIPILALLTGCIESFDYHPDNYNSLLVIDGGITNRKGIQTLRLSYSNQYGWYPFLAVGNAKINLYENSVLVPVSFTEVTPGHYQFDGSIVNAKPGNSYSIEIKLADGKEYRSTPEIMPEPVRPDSAYFKVEVIKKINDAGFMIEQQVVRVYINTPVKTGDHPSFLRWRVFEAYSFTQLQVCPFCYPPTCYMTPDPNYQDIQIFSSNNLSGGTLKGQLVLERDPLPDVQFYERHYFNVSQYSVSKNCFDYWTKLITVANPTGSFIDTPPAAVIGNVYNVNNNQDVVLGYFEVAAEEIARTYTLPGMMLPHYVYFPCVNGEDYCYDCLVLQNSSYDRPDYW
jgi:hypothetical protein